MHAIALLALLLFTTVSKATICGGFEDALFDPQQVRDDLTYLASGPLQGRKSGSEGARLAREFIAQRFSVLGLLTSDAKKANQPEDYFTQFSVQGLVEDSTGTNVVAMVLGRTYPDKVIVISAHYDHLGKSRGRVYPGADDNASGVAALMALAALASAQQPHHSYVYLATEYEEQGLFGAKAFVAEPPVALEQIQLNVNLDMLAQPGRRKTLYIGGTRDNPALGVTLSPLVESNPCAAFGHDGRTKSRYSGHFVDWRKASDHWAFSRVGIPYIYIGGDEHRFYHQPQDSAANVHWPFFYHAVALTINVVTRLDQHPFK